MYCCCKKYVPGRVSLFPFLLPPLVALHKRNCREAEGGSTVHLVWINVFRHPIQLKPWLDDCRAALYLCTFSQSPLTKPPLTTCRWKKSLLTTVFFPPSSLYTSSTWASTSTWDAACLSASICLCAPVWTTLQSGCLLLAGCCRLINSDRLPLRPTTYTSSKATRQHFKSKQVCPCSPEWFSTFC